MISLKQAQQIISEEINAIDFNLEPKELYEPISYILSLGGKRVRPALALLGCNIFTDNIKPAINAALALEILHNFTLLHDDIMDCANLRRGQQTVHIKWNDNVAILSGDAMSIKAFEFIAKCDQSHLKPVFDVFAKTAMQICEGQQFDMNFENRSFVSENEYLQMIELKTSVLLAACLKIGAICGNATETDANLLYEFGLNLGLAFQLQDDLLDVFGDECTFGKEIGKDIVSNKKTYLLIKALETAKGLNLLELNKWIEAKEFDSQKKIVEVKAIYQKLGIKELTIETIESYFQKALDGLKGISAREERKAELTSFLNELRNRKY